METICPKCGKPAKCIDTVTRKAYHKYASRVEFLAFVDDKNGICLLTKEEVEKYLSDLKESKKS